MLKAELEDAIISRERKNIAIHIRKQIEKEAVNSAIYQSYRKLAIELANWYEYPKGSDNRNNFFTYCGIEENPY